MKKIISALLCLAMLCSMVVSAAALTNNEASVNHKTLNNYELGDANGDGDANAMDALEMKKSYVALSVVDESASDINADGVINAKDLLILKKCFAEVDSLSNYENGEAIYKLTIGGNDISEYSIVYHADAKYVENNYYAADTLRKYIEIATGVNLPVVTEAKTAHKIEMVDVTTIEGLEEELAIEEYKYEVADGDLLIYGTRRGAMYAVYDILDDYLGYRFYFNQKVFEYCDRVADIPEGTSVFYNTALDFRHCKQGFHDAYAHYFPSKLNGTQVSLANDEAHGTLTGPHFINAHSYHYYYQMATGQVDVAYDGVNGDVYAAKYEAGIHYEEKEWNPCMTDDNMYATLFRGLLETIRYKKGAKHTLRDETSAMSFSVCDNGIFCSCAGCKYIYGTGTDRKLGERLNAGYMGLNLHLANRAARDIKQYYEGRAASYDENGDSTYSEFGYGEALYDAYPNLKIYTFIAGYENPPEKLFTDERYASMIPEDNLIVVFAGGPCNNHYIGSGECGDMVNNRGLSGTATDEAFQKWSEVFAKTGAEWWYWYYPTNYNVNFADSPNIFNIYHDFKYCVEEYGMTGLFYEGEVDNDANNFELLKAHLAGLLMYDFHINENGEIECMSFEEFCEAIKEYLYMDFGEGYEYIYEYIVMQDEAGNALGKCYENNLDYPGDMFDYDYIHDNYEYMRDLVLKAMAVAEGDQIKRCEYILINCEFLGLSAWHKDYLESTDEDWKAEYEERYTWMYEYIRGNYRNLAYKWATGIFDYELDLSKSPMKLYLGGGSWDRNSQWGWLGSTPGGLIH